MARDRATLIRDGETEATLTWAIETLAEIVPPSEKVARELKVIDDELQQELRTLTEKFL